MGKIKRKNWLISSLIALAFVFMAGLAFLGMPANMMTAYAASEDLIYNDITYSPLQPTQHTYWSNIESSWDVPPTQSGNYYIAEPNGSGYQYKLWTGWNVPTGTTRLMLNNAIVVLCQPIIVDNGSTLIIDEMPGKYGHIYCSSGVIVRVDGTNHSYVNGGNYIIVRNGGKLVMNGGSIARSLVEEYVPAVKVHEGGEFVLNGGSLYGHEEYEVYTAGNFVMNGGTLSGEGNFQRNGANKYGVQVVGGTCTINGGKIIKQQNHGILHQGGTLTINGGTISENNDCGVRSTGGDLYVTGNTVITGNKSKGIFREGGNIKLSSNPVIRDNGNRKNLVIKYTSSKIELVGAITDGADIGVTVWDDNNNSKQTLFTQYGGAGAGDYVDYFTSDDEHYYLQATVVNYGEYFANELYLFYSQHYHNDEYFLTWSRKDSLPSAEGSYYLLNNVVLTESWNVNSDIKLCLNGHTITGNISGDSVICVGENANLELSDHEEIGTITTSIENCESVIKVVGGTITINQAEITGSAKCGIKLVEGSTAFIHSGCTISGFSEQGIFIDNSSLNMDGGNITNTEGYGIYANSSSYLKLSGGTISGNSEGGVYTDGSIRVATSPVIINNGTAATRNVVLGGTEAQIIVDTSLEEGVEIRVTKLDSNGDETYGEYFSDDINYIDYFSSDNPLYRIISENGHLKIAKFKNISTSDPQYGSINVVSEAQVDTTVIISISVDDGYYLKNLGVFAGDISVELTTISPGEQYSFIMPDCAITIGAYICTTLTDVSVYQTGTLTYNGEPQTAQVVASATAQNDQQVVFTYSTTENGIYTTEVPALINAGTYTVYFKANAFYHDEYTGTFEVSIQKADITITKLPVAVENLKYDGSSQVLIGAGQTEIGTILYKLDNGNYSTAIPTASLVGIYTVYYKVVGNENYNDVDESSVQVEICENDKEDLLAIINSATDYYNSIKDEYGLIAEGLNTEIEKANQVYNNKNVTEAKIDNAILTLRIKLNETKNDVVNAKINAVIEKINDIGDVVYTAECKAKIDDARNSYNSLTPTEKLSVTNYNILITAEADYAILDNDHQIANNVIVKISEIGEVTYVGLHNTKIEGARNAYNNLTEEQKALVTNYQTLLDAEDAYNQLKLENETNIISNEETGVTIIINDGKTIPKTIKLQVGVNADVSVDKSSEEYTKVLSKLDKNEKIAKVYDIKLLDDNDDEIQPNDIDEGLTINVQITIPKGISTVKLKILHIHSSADVEYIEDYTISSDKISFNIDCLSEFAFVIPDVSNTGLSGWVIAGIVVGSVLILFLAGFCIYYFVIRKRKFAA